MIVIEIQHPNPYYDDSYAVNSANLGPYGDAITYELIPYIEKEFRAYCLVNIYKDENAYFTGPNYMYVDRAGHRNYLAEVNSTIRQNNYRELALGTKGRSGEQWDIWQAVYGPMGEDGYPKPIWDKLTGKIDHDVAEYWKENYDLRHILERDWSVLGAKLKGKLHI